MGLYQGPLAKLEKDAEKLETLGKVLKLLPSTIGVRLADGTNLDNFLDRFHQGLLTKRAHREEQQRQMNEWGNLAGGRNRGGKLEESTAGMTSSGVATMGLSTAETSLLKLVETGRATPTEHQRVRRMSLGDQKAFIDSRKALPRGTFEVSEAEQKRLVDLMFRRKS